jgi:predicted Zn-dependent protease
MNRKATRRELLFLLFLLALSGGFFVLRSQLFRDYSRQAERLYGAGDYDGALSSFLFASALDEGRGDDAMKVRRAQIFWEGRELEAAEKELLPLAEKRSSNAQAYSLLGRIYRARAQYGKADAYLARAYLLDGKTESFLLRIKNLVRGEQLEQAQALLEAERPAEGGEEADYYLLLVSFSRKGETPGLSRLAAGTYRSELARLKKFAQQTDEESNPDYAAVRKADLFVSLREPDFAYPLARRVAEKNPAYPAAWKMLGKALVLDDDFPAAAAALERCVALDVNDREAYLFLAGIYEKTGEKEKARAAQKRYTDLK